MFACNDPAFDLEACRWTVFEILFSAAGSTSGEMMPTLIAGPDIDRKMMTTLTAGPGCCC